MGAAGRRDTTHTALDLEDSIHQGALTFHGRTIDAELEALWQSPQIDLSAYGRSYWCPHGLDCGKESHPNWYLNMKANPSVTVQVGNDRYDGFAEDVADEERDALWATIVEINKHQGEYLQKAKRKIPLVWLRRKAAAT